MNVNLCIPPIPTQRIDSNKGKRCEWCTNYGGSMKASIYQCRLGKFHNGDHNFGRFAAVKEDTP